MIENYVERVHFEAMSFVKSIVDPGRPPTASTRITSSTSTASPSTRTAIRCAALRRSVSAKRLRINHYWTKSEQEFRRKCTAPEASVGMFRPWPRWDASRRHFSEVTDRELQAWGPSCAMRWSEPPFAARLIKRLSFRPMTRKWASCSAAGVLTFSTQLLDESRDFGEAVIVHELLHLIAPNHGALFKSLLQAYLPSWRDAVGDRAVCGASR